MPPPRSKRRPGRPHGPPARHGQGLKKPRARGPRPRRSEASRWSGRYAAALLAGLMALALLYRRTGADDALLFLGAGYAVLANLLAFHAFWLDKRRSGRAGARRIPEATLHLLAWLGGSLGALAGLVVLRHKTRHRVFIASVAGALAVHAALLVAALG